VDTEDTDKSDEQTAAEVEAAALRLLGFRDHSSGELRDKLDDRDYDAGLIENVIERLTEQGWLDDRRFAEHQTEILIRKGWGPRRIKQKLQKHGVPRDLAGETVADASDTRGWLETCRQRLLSRFEEPEKLDRDAKQKAFRHLEHRGFAPSIIRRVLFDDAGK
jgi:regulatory protein